MKHKYYVFIECCGMGMPWRGFMHDFSKLRPSEFFPRARYFKANQNELSVIDVERLKKALLLHRKRNKHHWQYWCCHDDVEGVMTVKIPEKYIKEMVADWVASAKSVGLYPTKWYLKTKGQMQITKQNHETIIKLLWNTKCMCL